MFRILALALFAISPPVHAQLNIVQPVAPPVDLSSYVQSVNTIPPVSGNVSIPTSTFVPGFTPTSPGTWANLLSTAPCNSARLSNYAVVSDLYGSNGSTNEVARCGATGATYYWRPQRENYTATITTTGGAMSFACGTSAPITFMNGTFSSTATVNLSTVGCWPGAQFQIANNATLGLFSLNITGLLGGVVRSLGLNGRQTFYYDYTNAAWQPF